MEMKNAMLLMSRDDGATMVQHPPVSPLDKKYRVSVGACFSHYKTLTPEQQVIHMLAFALFTLETNPELKVGDVINALEKSEELTKIVRHCIPSFGN